MLAIGFEQPYRAISVPRLKRERLINGVVFWPCDLQDARHTSTRCNQDRAPVTSWRLAGQRQLPAFAHQLNDRSQVRRQLNHHDLRIGLPRQG